MKKVYTAATPEEASAILAQIYGAGDPDIVIFGRTEFPATTASCMC